MEDVIEIRKKSKRRKLINEKIIPYVLLSLGAVIMIAPFIWMISTSLKEPGAVFTYPPEWIPRIQAQVDYNNTRVGLYTIEINGVQEKAIRLAVRKDIAEIKLYHDGSVTEEVLQVEEAKLKPYKKIQMIWKNYPDAWTAVPFARFFLNSIIVAFFVTFGQVLTCSLAAYAFARLTFWGRDKIFLAYLGTMMIPSQVTMIPVFILLKKLGWIDTYQALILPGMFSAYGTFLLRQFFLTVPKELEEAAIIDGCGKWRVYWQLIMPLSKPALATLTTFIFMFSWNDFMWPLIVTNEMTMKTLPVGLASFQGLYTTEWTLLMAAAVIVLIPVILVFVFNQRYFTEGIVLSGLKA